MPPPNKPGSQQEGVLLLGMVLRCPLSTCFCLDNESPEHSSRRRRDTRTTPLTGRWLLIWFCETSTDVPVNPYAKFLKKKNHLSNKHIQQRKSKKKMNKTNKT